MQEYAYLLIAYFVGPLDQHHFVHFVLLVLEEAIQEVQQQEFSIGLMHVKELEGIPLIELAFHECFEGGPCQIHIELDSLMEILVEIVLLEVEGE